MRQGLAGLKTPNHSPYTSTPSLHTHICVHMCAHTHSTPLCRIAHHPLCLPVLKACLFSLLPNCKLPAGRNQENIVFLVPGEVPVLQGRPRNVYQTGLNCWSEIQSSQGISFLPEQGQKCSSERMSLCLRHSFQGSPKRGKERSINTERLKPLFFSLSFFFSF